MTESLQKPELRLELDDLTEQLVSDVQRQRRTLELSERRVALAEENLRLLTRLGAVGHTSDEELAEADAELVGARASLVIERLCHDIALAALDQAVNGSAGAGPRDPG